MTEYIKRETHSRIKNKHVGIDLYHQLQKQIRYTKKNITKGGVEIFGGKSIRSFVGYSTQKF